jgi:alpha-L-fucosidase
MGGAANSTRHLAPGPFQPTWESLKQYKTPSWFRDAKFGIWAHWSAQCVPEQGDWYARNMYIQGSRQYDYHVSTYGHPSKFGFKDIDHIWGAENWQPDALMDLYVKAGAKYFMSLANHHDNLDCYASSHHNWNSTRVGPKKDIVGIWSKSARERGLKFGASNHSSHAWHWFQTAFGYDFEGPLAGVRYDGYTKASSGKGKWWDGLDPQELYVGPTFPLPDGLMSKQLQDNWRKEHDAKWSEEAPKLYPGFTENWFLRTQELVDKYDLDFLYFDDTEFPFGQTGLDVVADFYNRNLHKRGGKLEACVFGKQFTKDHLGAAVLDFERGRANEIQALPWQTDTCIGDWHYSSEVFRKHGYKSTKTVLQILADTVSKNGNLCLNIPLKGDGTIDSDEVNILHELAGWFSVNGEAIHGTRPFKVFGEGPPDAVSTGNFNEGKGRTYTAEDLRFTVKGGRLYAIGMEWPTSGMLKIKALAQDSSSFSSAIAKVELLGSTESLEFTRNTEGLMVKLPTRAITQLPFALCVTPTNLSMLA